MELYFAALTSSLACRIALYEARADVTFIGVDFARRPLRSDHPHYAVHRLGLVPVLRTHAGVLLGETSAVLHHIAERFPAAGLAPQDRDELNRWLSFIASELHKSIFHPLFDPEAPAAVRAYALLKAGPRLAYMNDHLEGREFMFDTFSVADAFLFTVLNWVQATPIEFDVYPELLAYWRRLAKRPSIAQALAVERPLYQGMER
ncbi:MAG: glutathione binding-like protein [Nannocystaceae bacterium]